MGVLLFDATKIMNYDLGDGSMLATNRSRDSAHILVNDVCQAIVTRFGGH